MSWLLLGVTCIAFAGIAFVGWQKWIAPWRHIEQLVRQIAGGEQPRTFLVNGGTLAQRVGLALESISAGSNNSSSRSQDANPGRKQFLERYRMACSWPTRVDISR